MVLNTGAFELPSSEGKQKYLILQL